MLCCDAEIVIIAVLDDGNLMQENSFIYVSLSLSALVHIVYDGKNLANCCMVKYCVYFSQSLGFVVVSNPGTSEGNVAAIRADSSVL